MKHILRYTAALFCVVLALTACLPEEPVHETINMGAGELTNLSSSAASLMCEIEDELPKYSKIEYGIVYSDNREKVENHKGVKKIEGQGLSENRFTVQLVDLKAKQEYFYCSYLRIDEGRMIYGDISSFVTKASYKASFDANGGKGGMEPQHFEEDDNKALTENTFTREHHEFAGWNTKSDGSGSYYQPGLLYTLSEDVKLFAQWQAYSGMEEGYTYVDLGLSVEWATRNVGAERREAYGDYFAWGETQPKSNYAWETYQWGIASDLLTKYCIDAAHGKNGATDGKTVLELSDDAARVQWKGDWRMPTLAEQQELREKCSWKWKNLNGIAGYEVTGPSGKSIFLPAAGFKNNDALHQAGSYGCYWSSNLYEIQSDYAYYLNIIPSTHEQAQYSRSYGYSLRPVYTTYYCLRFDANGGSGKMDSLMVKKTETATLPANTFTREGYIFTTWNTAPDGSGTKVTDQTKFSPTSDTTFYAQWHKVWMLHFDANGGKYNGSGTTMPDQQFKDGEAQEIEANVFTREKHKFVCWNTKADGSGDSIVNQQEVLLTSDTTLYAQWHELYTITFHANGGSGSATTFNQTFEEGVSGQLLNNLFSRTYYVFTGWNTKADGSGVSYDDKATITASSDMDLYAQWKAVYKLTFNGNGAASNMAPQTFYAGEAQQINKNTITRSGYKFMAWNTKVDGSGTSYKDGEIITLKSNMTLFAQWYAVSGTAQGYDYVDLGLPSGTKWATCNVGATQPYEYGDYYAWGETVTKKSYAWNNYKHGQRNLLTKYCYDIDEGKDDFVDYLNMLLSVDDVASFKWGANWRMPLESEIKELIEKCTWTWTWNALVGVHGYMVKGSNGNTIFLPAAGSYDGSELFEKDREAYYWTGSLQSSGNSNAACALSFSATERHANLYARAYGHSVRPVLSLEYSIFFDANGGTGTMSVQKVQKGASLNLKSNAFTKDGYVFTGWNTRADGEGRSYANLATMIPMENMQLYAQWHPLVYVFLNPNGGTGTQVKQTLKKDVETSLSENPFTRKGYVFDSWNTKADGTGTSYADKASITLSKDLQLYAQWKKEGYTITFNANGGKGEMKSMQFVYSENQTLPQNTYTRESSIFVGWNTKADGTGVSYADGMSCTFEANTTLYAQWLVISGNQDGKDYVDLGLSVQWAVYNIGAERPEQYGDYFAWGETQPKEVYSWTNYAHGTATNALTKYTDSDGLTHLEKEDDAAMTNWGGDWRMPTQEEMAELLNKCSWHWTTMNGVTGYLVSAQNGNSLFLPAAGYCISQAIDGGTYGRYWTSDKHQYASAQYLVMNETSAIVSYVPRSEGHTIRPVLSDKALIEFNANGGSGSMTAFKPKKGELVALPKNAYNRAKYAFAGWNTKADGSGTHYEDGASITPGVYVKLFAQWTPSYSISFDENGGEGSMSTLQVKKGYSQELPENAFIREYHDFDTWNTEADGSGTSYSPGDTIMPTKDITLYAQWNRYYVVSFYPNGGSGSMEKQRFDEGEEKELTPNAFTRLGYEFYAWNTSPDGTVTSYRDKQTISLTSNLSLYAQWKHIYNVHFVANGGSGTMPSQQFFGGVEQSLVANTFTKNGYIFIGWNTMADGSGTWFDETASITVGKDITLYAQWMQADGEENGHAYVDLGLPSGTKWAVYNVGAHNPEEYGDYFAFGETEPKDEYSWNNYKFGAAIQDFVKYNSLIDDKTLLDAEDDAAHVNWGGNWRMPLSQDFKELLNNCTSVWTKVGYVNGYKLTSKINGNSIFLPAAGYKYDRNWVFENSYAFYRAADKQRDGHGNAIQGRDGGAISETSLWMREACSVRPILSSAYSITFDANGGSGTMEVQKISVGQSQTIAANTFTKAGYEFAGWNTAADGSGTSYTNEQLVTLEWDLKLYAQWKVYVSGTENGHGYIDLGLPSGTKWAAYNVGATKPIEYGDFFAWGETKPKNDYQWSTYQFGNGSNNLTKYNGKDGKDSFLDAEDDAAAVNWGGNWRMPTNAEQEELLNNCTWTWTTQDGIRGYMLTSKHNDNTLFIPAGGYKYGTSVREQSSRGYYWMLSSVEGNTSNSGYFNFYSNSKSVTNEQKMYGGTIRPVLVANHTITFDANGGSGSMESLSAAKGLCAISKNLFTRDAYIFVGWNTKSDGSGVSYKEQQRIIISENTTLYAQWMEVSGTENGHGYIDLGLPSGTKWAVYNVGASTPTGYGNYYAWGETEPKSQYHWSNYKYCQGTDRELTKYCIDNRYGHNGFTDGKTTIDASDDAARVNMGSNWRMPTVEEIQELIDNCQWEYILVNEIPCQKATSKVNGKTITLPIAGDFTGNSLTDLHSYGDYWIGSLASVDCANTFRFSSGGGDVYRSSYYRYSGHTIRAVFSSNYFLSFHANGGSGNMTNQSFDAGETRNIYDNAFTKAGYDFVGWNTEMDGSGTAYANEAAISINYNTMLFAQWKVSSFTVNFDANGGSGSMSSQSFQGDTEQAIQANTFTRANAFFVGWNTAADGSGTSYSDKQAALITDNLTLYAQWQVVSGSEQGHDYVDLGLSVKWATYNLGADSPSDYGNYYAWSETAPKTRYDWDRYKLTAYDGATPWLTKYCNDASKGKNGYVDNFTMLELADDAAHANYGGNWRMPTTQEMQELRDKCTWMRTSMNGIQGYKITSNINGNSIFLPAAGYKYDTNLSDEGYNAYYWTNTFDTGNSLQAKELRNDRTNQNRDRNHGCSVRPVCIDAVTITFDANGGTGSMSPINAVAGLCTIPENAFIRTNAYFVGWNTMADGSGTSYSDKQASLITDNLTLYAQWQVVSGSEQGYEYVDLGLPSGLKWATCNIGATTPEGYGDYFAWGETTSKSDYTWSTYKYTKGSGKTITKYNTESSSGTVDNKTTLELSDDAARANWGGKWRMPTKAELDELRNNCTWTWTTQNGVSGYKVASKINRNSIFLPAAGDRNGASVNNVGSSGYYWSSSLYGVTPHRSYRMRFDSGQVDWYDDYIRSLGHTVRAVCP